MIDIIIFGVHINISYNAYLDREEKRFNNWLNIKAESNHSRYSIFKKSKDFVDLFIELLIEKETSFNIKNVIEQNLTFQSEFMAEKGSDSTISDNNELNILNDDDNNHSSTKPSTSQQPIYIFPLCP